MKTVSFLVIENLTNCCYWGTVYYCLCTLILDKFGGFSIENIFKAVEISSFLLRIQTAIVLFDRQEPERIWPWPATANLLTRDDDVSSITVYISQLVGFRSHLGLSFLPDMCIWLCLNILYFFLINSVKLLLNSHLEVIHKCHYIVLFYKWWTACKRGLSSPSGIHKQ